MNSDGAEANTVSDLFDLGIALERRAAEIYDRFSSGFSHEPQVQAFWKGMVADEIEHAETLERIRDALPAADLDRRIDAKIWIEAIEIKRFLSGDSIEAIETLEDAYMLAHEIEFSEVNTIFKFLAEKSVPFETRAEFVLSQITHHQDKITSFDAKFGSREWRRRIAILK